MVVSAIINFLLEKASSEVFCLRVHITLSTGESGGVGATTFFFSNSPDVNINVNYSLI